jgi:CDP-glucose 4,6-dehydratase
MTRTGWGIDSGFWRDRRVLLTGHTGFKGSWLSLWLQDLGAQVRGIALAPPTHPALFDVARVAVGMEHHTADIQDLSAMVAEMKGFRPEIVIHMAAQALVRQSFHDPVGNYATNVMGTVHVLEAARKAGTVRAIVNVTSDKCYDNRGWHWPYRESDGLGGHDPYASSKACAELVSAAYRDSFLEGEGIALATARAGNVIGGGDWAQDRLVPDVLRALERGHIVTLRHPDAIRPWQHVLEPLSGYLLLAERLIKQGGAFARAWNFGPREEDARPVRELVECLCMHWGRSAGWQVQPGVHPPEAAVLKLDTSEARALLNWCPRWTLDETLRGIVEWHRHWRDGEDMRAVCLEAIRA